MLHQWKPTFLVYAKADATEQMSQERYQTSKRLAKMMSENNRLFSNDRCHYKAFLGENWSQTLPSGLKKMLHISPAERPGAIAESAEKN